MTTLAAGSGVALAISNNGFLEVSTNGGLGSVTITPTNGAAVTESWGPGVFRKRWNGPYPDGAAVVLSNTSSAVFDYEADSSNLPATLQALATWGGIAYPTDLTTAGITAAAQALAAAGGGIVQLPAGEITLQEPGLPLLANVRYRGAGWKLTTTYARAAGGTWLLGDGTFPAFFGVGGAGGGSTAQATLGDQALPVNTSPEAVDFIYGCGVSDLGVSNFSYGIKCGALFAPGCAAGYFENIAARGCTQWGFWFENCFAQSEMRGLRAYFNTNGTAYYSSSTSIFVPGNFAISSPLQYGNTNRHFVLGARRGSSINAVRINDGFDSIGPAVPPNVTQAATFIGAPVAVAGCTIAANACTGTVSDGAGNLGHFLDISALGTGAIYPGMVVTGTGTRPETYVVSQVSGTPNGVGRYLLSTPLQRTTPQTFNVGGVLSGAGFATDMTISGTGVASFGLGTEPTFICGGSGSTWYVSNPTVVASTTITGSYTTVNVTDLSKFAVGMPVYFDGSVNGVGASRVYFVRSMSAATGAGGMTLSLNKGGNAGLPFSGTSAVNIKTAGFPLVEIVGEDFASYVFNCQTPVMDLERGGTTKLLIQGGKVGCRASIGYADATGGASALVMRLCVVGVVVENLYSSLAIDLDSNNYTLLGYTPGTVVGSTNIGVGFQQNVTSGRGQVNLTGFSAPEIFSADSQTKFQRQGIATPSLNTAVTTTLTTAYNNVTFSASGGSGQTLTMPTPASTNLGFAYDIFNASANSVTIASATLNIVGLGATGTSVSLATKTGARFTVSYDGSAYFWAQS